MSNFGDHPAGFFGDSSFYNGVVTTSLRFNKGSSSRLTFTPDSDGGDTWTWSAWYKVSNGTGSSEVTDKLFMTGDGAGIQHRNTRQLGLDDDGDTNNLSTELYRDTSSWYHILANSNGSTSKLFVNGTEVTLSGSPNIGDINNSTEHYIGSGGSNYYTDGYLADINFVSGTALTPSSFTETKNGVLIPINPNVTYGGNGWRLQFLQTGTNADANGIGADTSGNNNHWAVDNLNAHDVVPDSPENNFCTINSIREDTLVNGSVTLTEGNLQSVDGGTTYGRHWSGTFGMSTGKWYWEVLAHTLGASSANIGLGNDTEKQSVAISSGSINVYYGNDGKRNPRAANTETTNYGATYADGDIIGIAFDADNESVTFFKNNSTQGAVGSILVQSTGPYFPSVGDGQNSTTYKYVANFGQDSSFAGNKTAQGNTDGNGQGDFFYTPPSGHLALCSSNLPEPTIGPNSATQSDDHHNTVLYTGNGADDRSISGVGFKPDWTWLRARSAAYDAEVYDSNRGATKRLRSRKGEAEATKLNNLQAFESDGFQVGTDADVNENNTTYVAWNWKANGGTTSTLDAGTIDATVQANQDAGFSIITFVSNQQASQTVAHGLGVAPDMFFQKSRDENNYWYWYVRPVGAGAFLSWVEGNDGFAAAESSTGTFGNTHPTDTLLTVGLANTSHDSGHNILSYCFASKEGFSKVGSYTGNGSDNGTFVFLGFKPAWIMIKCSSASSAFTGWILYDNKRKTFNDDVGDNSNPFIVNKLSAEGERGNGTTDLSGNALSLDFLSNGFKCRDNADEINTSGETYIFLAFAEAPFKYANAR